eukprot:6167071-Alexandrium_andersonii.AAC.1
MGSGGLRHRRKRRGEAARERRRDPPAAHEPRSETLPMCKVVHCSAACEVGEAQTAASTGCRAKPPRTPWPPKLTSA